MTQAEVQPQPERTELASLVEEALTLVASSGLAPYEAAEKVWNPLRVFPDDLIELAQVGFKQKVDWLWDAHRQPESKDAQGRSVPRVPFGRRHVRPAEAATLARIYLKDAHGKQRPIYRFTLEDWDSFSQLASAQEAGWKRRQVLAKEAVKTLKRHGVERTSDLPRDEVYRLDLIAKEAWEK